MAVTIGPGVNSICNNIPMGDMGPFQVRAYNIMAWITVGPMLLGSALF